MGLFTKKHENFTVIEHAFSENNLVEKAEAREICDGSQLIVHEGQQAVFFMNGRALDLFGPGRHTLKTETLPYLSDIYKVPTKGKNPFLAEVYFVNVAEHPGEKWGYPGHFIYTDPIRNNIPFSLGVRGIMSFCISDARRFLIKIVGDRNTVAKNLTVDNYVTMIAGNTSECIIKVCHERRLSVFDLDSNRSECAKLILPELNEKLANHGITITQFEITNYEMPTNDPNYIKLGQVITDTAAVDETTKAFLKNTSAIATAEGMLGVSHKEVLAYDVANNVAQNSAAGGLAAMGTGMGMMGGMAVGTGAMMSSVVNSAMAPLNSTYSSAPASGAGGAVVPGMPRGLELRKDASAPASPSGSNELQTPFQKLDRLKTLNIISDDEYQKCRAELIKELTK